MRKVLEKRFFQIIFILFLFCTPAFLLFLSTVGFFSSEDHNLKAILDWKPQSETKVYDREGNELTSFYNRHQIYYSFDELPEKLVQAIIAIEDKNYWTHSGFDFMAMVRTALRNLRYPNKKRGGASTITQQLVKNFVSSDERSYVRKIREVILAYRLEKRIPKERTLEIYLNSLFLGSGSYGVGSASIRYFGKDLEDLKTHELALIAGLFQAPSYLNPFKNPNAAKRRQVQVLRAMVLNHFMTKKDYYEEIKKELDYVPYKSIKKAPYFLDYIAKEAAKILGEKTVKNKGFHIYTTLDPLRQLIAEETISEKESSFLFLEQELQDQAVVDSNLLEIEKPSNRIEAALLSNDIDSGAILAMVGGRDYLHSQFNRAAQSYRQPGSAFKPITYSFALKNGYKWSDVKFIAPLNLPGDYKPRSYAGDYLSESTLLRALYRSINSVSIDLGKELGLQEVISFAKTLGVKSNLKEEFGTLLGSSEVRLFDLARVYSTFGNGGLQTKLYAIEKIENDSGEALYDHDNEERFRKQVLSRDKSSLVTRGLQSVFKHGTARLYKSLANYAAGKTGTSNGSKDNWFCGYTEKTATIVWVGSDDFKSLGPSASGAHLALPVWANYVSKEVKDFYLKPFEENPDLIELKIDPKHGFLSENGIPMWFEKDNLPEKTKSALDFFSKKSLYRSY